MFQQGSWYAHAATALLSADSCIIATASSVVGAILVIETALQLATPQGKNPAGAIKAAVQEVAPFFAVAILSVGP
jgi:hypothetical protein